MTACVGVRWTAEVGGRETRETAAGVPGGSRVSRQRGRPSPGLERAAAAVRAVLVRAAVAASAMQ